MKTARLFLGSASEQALELWLHYRSYLPLHRAVRMARRHARTLDAFDPKIAAALRSLLLRHSRGSNA